MRRTPVNASIVALCIAMSSPCATHAGGIPTTASWLEEIVVTGRIEQLGGAPISATAGIVTSEQLDLRPVLRTGELLEVVPGLIVTQHSGDGKANQYFLRGFNLDHGTDLAISVGGVPVNMPTHAHGQGYTDINFVIPELVNSVEYRKGTYYAESGNFSSAGAVNMRYRDVLDAPLALLEAGENDYSRAPLAAWPEIGDGAVLFGFDHSQSDGPWLLLDRYGFVDPGVGGESHRYSLGLDWTAQLGRGEVHALAYAIDYGLDLFSNFTYALDPENGDQFEQLDDRRVCGAAASWRRSIGPLNDLALGAEWRRDDIDAVGVEPRTVRVTLTGSF